MEKALYFKKQNIAKDGEENTMAAMKEEFTGLQESIYKKLESLGVSRENIFEFETLLVQSGLEMDFGEFAGRMAGYAVGIYYLSEVTRYAPERLWGIWKDMVRDYLVEYDNSEESISSLEQEWKTFRGITEERDW